VLVLVTSWVPSGEPKSALAGDLANVKRRGLELTVSDLGAGWTEGVTTSPSGGVLGLGDRTLRSAAVGEAIQYGVAESTVHELQGLYSVEALHVRADLPPGTSVVAEIRGYANGEWSEWREAVTVDDLDGVRAVQTRLWLQTDVPGTSPRIFGAAISLAPAVRAVQMPARRVPSVKLWATREGMVGGTTANGHVIAERDRFVALPSKRALNRRDGTDYVVMLRYRGRTATAPVWDVGPWNIRDDYWNDAREQFPDVTRWLPQAEAAFFAGHNAGRDGSGRFVTIPASIDLADGTFWDDLGMTSSDWVDVTFLWVDAASPPGRPTPVVIPKSAPASGSKAASNGGSKPSTRLYLPLIQNDPSSWTTTITIQNPSPIPVAGLVAVRDAAGAQVGQTNLTLRPFASFVLLPSAIAGVPSGFAGGAIVTASGPVTAVVDGDRPGADRWSYEGITEVGPSSVLPLAFKDYNGWNTGLQIQNLGAQQTVQVQYIGDAGTRVETLSLVPLGSYTLYPVGATRLTGSFAGSVVVQSENGQPVAVVATHANVAGAAMAYAGSPSGGAQLFAPLVFSRYHGWSSGLRLFNLTPTAAAATVGYKGTGLGPSEAFENTTIPGLRALTLYQPSQSQLPEGFVGSASVVAGPGSYLSGVVSKVKAGAQVAMIYSAGRSGGPLVAVPSVSKSEDGWNTGIQVQNPGPVPAAVSLAFHDEDGTLVHRIESILDGASTQTYYVPAIPEIPAGFHGSAVVQSPAAVAGLIVVVNETAD
jgi:hypothetical protein